MSWFRIDDKSAFHRKVLKAGNEAWGAICRAGAVSAGEGTDGRVTKETMLAIAPMKVWQRALGAGLVDRIDETTFQLHDYLQWNESASEIEARAAARRKKSQDAAEARWGARGRLRTPEQPPADAEAMPGECPEHAAGMQEALPHAHTPSCPIPIHTVPERSSIQKPPPPQLPPEPRASAPAGGDGGGRAATFGVTDPGLTEDAALDELHKHPQLSHVVSGATHAPKTLVQVARHNSVNLEQLAECVGYVASLTPDGESVSATLGRLRGALMKVHKRAASQRQRERDDAQRQPESAPRPKLPPGTGRLPPPMPMPERIVPARPPGVATLGALGASPVPPRSHADVGGSPTPGRAHSVSPTGIGDLLASFPRQPGEP